jgi:hypothetical protein
MDLVHVLASLLTGTHQRCGRVIRRLPPRAPDGSGVRQPVDGWIVRGFHNYGWRPGQPLWLKRLPLVNKSSMMKPKLDAVAVSTDNFQFTKGSHNTTELQRKAKSLDLRSKIIHHTRLLVEARCDRLRTDADDRLCSSPPLPSFFDLVSLRTIAAPFFNTDPRRCFGFISCIATSSPNSDNRIRQIERYLWGCRIVRLWC